MVDTDFVAPGDVIISDELHKHFGQGQLTTILELKPGVHVLRLQFGNGAHIALDGPHTRYDYGHCGINNHCITNRSQRRFQPSFLAGDPNGDLDRHTHTRAAMPMVTPPKRQRPPPARYGSTNRWDGYVYVPGGEFTMGANEDKAVSPLEQPAQQVTTADFWLQRTEVTGMRSIRGV